MKIHFIIAALLFWIGHAFSPVPWASVSRSARQLHYSYEQQPGESDIAFIKRITSQPVVSRNNTQSSPSSADDGQPKTGYQRVEDWDAERKAKGALAWDEKVQFDGQRFGNQVRQDSILRKHLSSW